MPALVPGVKILKKIGVTRRIWEKVGVKLLSHLTEKSVNFSTLVASNIRLLLFFVIATKLVGFVRKKFIITEENLGKLQLFDETISLPEPKFYSRIYGGCNSLQCGIV